MKAHIGDRMVISGHHQGEPARTGEVLRADGDDGGPPYLVRWDEDGHESIYFPGSDAHVEHVAHRASGSQARRAG